MQSATFGPTPTKLAHKYLFASKGIRILRQDIVETILSFIISANNNIPRIQGILNRIAPQGHFPTIEELTKLTENACHTYQLSFVLLLLEMQNFQISLGIFF